MYPSRPWLACSTVRAEASAADWLAAWGQIGGAVGTVATLSVAIWLARRDSRWRKAEQADRDIAQARMLTVDTDYSYGGSSPYQAIVIIANNSNQPLFEVKIESFRSASEPGLKWRFGAIDPDTPVSANVLRPDRQLVVDVEFVDDNNKQQWPGGTDSTTVTYMDSSGLRWRRVDRELPVRIIDEPTTP